MSISGLNLNIKRISNGYTIGGYTTAVIDDDNEESWATEAPYSSPYLEVRYAATLGEVSAYVAEVACTQFSKGD